MGNINYSINVTDAKERVNDFTIELPMKPLKAQQQEQQIVDTARTSNDGLDNGDDLNGKQAGVDVSHLGVELFSSNRY